MIGFAVSARVSALAHRTPSMLSNVVPLRLRLSGEISIDELMSRSGRAIREVMRHQRYPSLALRRDLQLSPLEPDVYSLAVNFMPFDHGASFGGHFASTHNLSNGPVADLSIGVFDGPRQTELRIDLNGNCELYEDAVLAEQLNHLVALLAAIAHEPTTRPIDALLARAEAPAVNPPKRSSVASSNSLSILMASKGQTSTQIWQLMQTRWLWWTGPVASPIASCSGVRMRSPPH